MLYHCAIVTCQASLSELWRCVTQHNDNDHNCCTLIPSITFILYRGLHFCFYSECHYAGCWHAEWRHAECRYSEFSYSTAPIIVTYFPWNSENLINIFTLVKGTTRWCDTIKARNKPLLFGQMYKDIYYRNFYQCPCSIEVNLLSYRCNLRVKKLTATASDAISLQSN
jgi:hypothetical protein